MATRTYNPDRVAVIVGPAEIKGFVDGTFVAISEIGDGVTSQSGADGEVARAISSDRRHSITITLQQTSESNDILSGLYAADRKTCGGAMVPIMVKDLCGRTLFSAAEAWVTKTPDAAFGTEISERAWVLHTGAPVVYLIGGQGS